MANGGVRLRTASQFFNTMVMKGGGTLPHGLMLLLLQTYVSKPVVYGKELLFVFLGLGRFFINP